MSRNLTDEEFEKARTLDGPDRYCYALEAIRESGELWLLSEGDELATFRTPVGERAVCIWPHERFAQEHAVETWSGFTPWCLELDDFYRTSYPYLLEKGLSVGVFYTSPGVAVIVPVDVFESGLRNGPQAR